MKVTELQLFIKSLAGAVKASDGSKVASELERVAAGLQPFQALNVSELADFLAIAETYRRDGILPVKGGRGAKAPKAAPADLKDIAQSVLALYERATDPTLQHSEIESAVKKLEKNITKDDAIALAREVGIERTVKSKKDALEQIRLMISTRKESFDRTQFRNEDPARI